jgi:hypothetical protein
MTCSLHLDLPYMPTPSSPDLRRRAKSYLSYCYRAGVIGPYRRLHTVWVLSRADGELVLDDLEVATYLEWALDADPELLHSFDSMDAEDGSRHPLSGALIDN